MSTKKKVETPTTEEIPMEVYKEPVHADEFDIEQPVASASVEAASAPDSVQADVQAEETTQQIVDKINSREGHYFFVLEEGEEFSELFAIHDSTPQLLHEETGVKNIMRNAAAEEQESGEFQIGPHKYFKGTKEQVHAFIAH